MMKLDKGRARPLECSYCASGRAFHDARKGFRIERGVQRRKRGGRMIEVVNVTHSCGYEWWSTNKAAIERSRKRDARAKAKKKGARSGLVQTGAVLDLSGKLDYPLTSRPLGHYP